MRASRTAEGVAAYRAVHQRLDSPLVLVDPLAEKILTPHLAATVRDAPERLEESRTARPTRAIVVVRSRIAEDEIARAAAEGVTQYVLLGAGLDTFAYRNPHPGVRVFEVDHPAMQAVKQQRLRDAAIPIPGTVGFVPCDFSRDTLARALEAAGFDRSRGAVFGWLGVVMYLAPADVAKTLRYVGGQAAPATVIFDYALPPATLPFMYRWIYRRYLDRLSEKGEPWKSFSTPAALRQQLKDAGFTDIEDLGADEINARYLSGRTDGLAARGVGRIAIARRPRNG